MKKTFLTAIISLFISCVFGAGSERVCFATVNGPICSVSNFGFVNPCQPVSFVVDQISSPPVGYVMVGKFEWFVNGVSVKVTTNPTDPVLPDWSIKSKQTNVYCKVWYKDQSGNLSAPYTSTTLTPDVRDIDFPSGISTSTPPPNYGCSTGTVSYSLPETPCTQLCNYTYNVNGNYNITWQAPIGWVQTSISNNGSNVSFTPNATSAGALTATITLPCGYKETRTYTITRGTPPPSFTSSTISSCTSSATASINPVCGASSYTYNIAGNAGVKFSANNLQTLTTTSTSVGISISGGSSINTIKAKANYANNTSSADANATLAAGVQTPILNAIPVSLPGEPTKIEVYATYAYGSTNPIPGVTTYRWYLNGVLQTATGNKFIWYIACNRTSTLACEVVNACGTSSRVSIEEIGGCRDLYTVSPNPTTDDATIAIDQTNTESTANLTFDAVKVYDMQGNLKKYLKYDKQKQAKINLSELNRGTYFIEVINGDYKEKHQLIIQK